MSGLSPLELEGRLNGQRKVLTAILAQLMSVSGADFSHRIEAMAEISGHQEDPGALPEPAFAIEAAAALEVRLLLDRARALQAAR